MSGTDINLFFDSPPEKERVLEVAQFDVIYKCKGKNGCGRNIPNANIRGTLIHCDNCGKTYSIQPIHWSGGP